MKFTMQDNTGVPVGGYAAEYVGAEAFENESDYGPAVKLKWRILDGEHQGAETTRIVSQKLSPKVQPLQVREVSQGQ